MKENIEEKLADFDWHDCTVYALRFDDNLVLDLDYILEWKIENKTRYQYLIAPALLEFTGVSDFKLNIETDILNGFEIDKILLERDTWKILLQEGVIEFKAEGFTQIYTKEPVWKTNQYLSEEERRE